jgi:hypothetical protein
VNSRLILLLPEQSSGIHKTLASLADRHLTLPPILVAHEEGTERSVQIILEAAAEYKLDSLRLIALRLGSPPSEIQVKREEEIAQQVGASCKPAQVHFTRGVVADASVTDLTENCFHRGWDFNFIIEPVDSIGETGFLAAPLSSENADASLIGAAVMIGGSLNFLEAGIIDEWKEGKADALIKLRLARWHLRIVDVRDLTSEVVDLALSEGSGWNFPEDCTSMPSTDSAIDSVAKDIRENLRFEYQRSAKEPDNRVTKIGIFRAWRMYFRRLSQMMTKVSMAMSREVTDAFKENIAELSQKATFGKASHIQIVAPEEKSAVRVPLNHRWRDELIRSYEGKIPDAVPETKTWEAMTSVMLGLADGGDFVHSMAGHELEHEQKRGVITDPSKIIRLDNQPFQLTKDQATALKIDERTLTIDSYDGVTANIFDRTLILASISKGGIAESVRTRFKEWRANQKNCLALQISQDLGKAAGKAYDDFLRYDAEWEDIEDSLNEAVERQQKGQKSVRNTAIMLICLLAIPALLAYALKGSAVAKLFETEKVFWLFEWGDKTAWALFFVGTLAWLLTALTVIARAARELVQAEHQILFLAKRPKHIFDGRTRALSEFARISYLSAQFSDWAAAISVVLHEPYGDANSAPYDESSIEDHPLRCLVIGTPEVSLGTKSGAALAIRRRIVNRSWLQHQFRWYQNKVAQHIAVLKKIPYEEIKFASDTSTSPDFITIPATDMVLFSPLKQLRSMLEDRTYSSTARSELVESLSDLSPPELAELVNSVQSPVNDLNDRRVRDFIDPLTSPAYAPAFSYSYARANVTPADMEVETSWSGSTFSNFTSNKSKKLVVGRDLITSYRLQISQAFTPDELSLIKKSKPEEDFDDGETDFDPDDVA